MYDNSIKVFVAEDDPIELAGFCTMLEELGHTVVGYANTGKKAVEGVLETSPDLILMDINMPDMDGITAIEKINNIRITPCIIITGYRDFSLSERASDAGAFGYLQKPVDEYEIQSAINVACQRFREYEQIHEKLVKSEQALVDRKIIERAKGILMDNMCMGEQQAMDFLQKKSRDSNQKLVRIAEEIIKRQETFKF